MALILFKCAKLLMEYLLYDPRLSLALQCISLRLLGAASIAASFLVTHKILFLLYSKLLKPFESERNLEEILLNDSIGTLDNLCSSCL